MPNSKFSPRPTCLTCPTRLTCPTCPTRLTCPTCPTHPTCPTRPTCLTRPTCPTRLTCPSHLNPPSFLILKKNFFLIYPIQTIYKRYRKSEGKSASWRSRVCDEQLPKYKRLLIALKPEKNTAFTKSPKFKS